MGFSPDNFVVGAKAPDVSIAQFFHRLKPVAIQNSSF